MKINVKVTGVTNNCGKEVPQSIQLRFLDRCRFMTSRLDELANNSCDTSAIQCDKYLGEKDLVHISSKY